MTRSQQLAFVADASDARNLLQQVIAGREHTLRFAGTGLFNLPEIADLSVDDLRKVGIARTGDINHEPTYLVAAIGTRFAVRPVPQRHGGVLYAVDQLLNPDTVALTFGGRYSNDILISGRVGTASSARASVDLYEFFARLIRATFTKVLWWSKTLAGGNAS